MATDGSIEVALHFNQGESPSGRRRGDDLSSVLKKAVSVPDGEWGQILSSSHLKPSAKRLRQSPNPDIAHFGQSLKSCANSNPTVVLDSQDEPSWGLIVVRRVDVWLEPDGCPILIVAEHRVIDGFALDWSDIPVEAFLMEAAWTMVFGAHLTKWLTMERPQQQPLVQHHVVGNSFGDGHPLNAIAESISSTLAASDFSMVPQLGPFLCASGHRRTAEPGVSDATSMRLRALGADLVIPHGWATLSDNDALGDENPDHMCRVLGDDEAEWHELTVATGFEFGSPETWLPLGVGTNLVVQAMESDERLAVFNVAEHFDLDATGPMDVVRLSLEIGHSWGLTDAHDILLRLAEELRRHISATLTAIGVKRSRDLKVETTITVPSAVAALLRPKLQRDIEKTTHLLKDIFGSRCTIASVEIVEYTPAPAKQWPADYQDLNFPLLQEPATLVSEMIEDVIREAHNIDWSEDEAEGFHGEWFVLDRNFEADDADAGTLVPLSDCDGEETYVPFLVVVAQAPNTSRHAFVISSLTLRPVQVVPSAIKAETVHPGEFGVAVLRDLRKHGLESIFDTSGKPKRRRTAEKTDLRRLLATRLKLDAAVIEYTDAFPDYETVPKRARMILDRQLAPDERLHIREVLGEDSWGDLTEADSRNPLVVIPNRCDFGDGPGETARAVQHLLFEGTNGMCDQGDMHEVAYAALLWLVPMKAAITLGAAAGAATLARVAEAEGIIREVLGAKAAVFLAQRIASEFGIEGAMRAYEASAKTAAIIDDMVDGEYRKHGRKKAA